MSYADDLAALVNALVEDETKKLAARMTGNPVLGGVGSSLGGVALSTEGAIDKGESGGDEGAGDNEDLKGPLKPGDEPEKLKLFDCETNEEVTIDGLGGGSGPAYPTGFDGCQKPKKPTMDDLVDKIIYIHTLKRKSRSIDDETRSYSIDKARFYENASTARSFVNSAQCPPPEYPNAVCLDVQEQQMENSISYSRSIQSSGLTMQIAYAQASYGECTSIACKQSYIDNWTEESWPAPDKNHLVWNAEKGCMEPLCPELNNQVSAKYQGCNDEMILCDEDGNKVKVQIENGEMKVTQAKYNQEATIKDGKVQSTKPLTAEQTAREFK